MSKILLCDGHNLAFRAFYGIKELNRSDGFPTNMIHGWLRSFWKIEDDLRPKHVRVFFDKGGATRRESLLPSYKENRGAPPEDFSNQLEWVKKLSKALGYGVHERSGLEADDLIASAVEVYKKSNESVLMVSADKDLAQLICPGVEQLLPPPTAGRIKPKRFCSLIYEKKDDLRRNIELIRLESDVHLDLNDLGPPDFVLMEEIFKDLEMRKSWEEAKKRYNQI